MRIIATLADHEIVQVEKNPPDGVAVTRNGMYNIPVPEGVKVRVLPGSFVLPPTDPNSVVAQSYAGLLAQFPQYGNILFNPLIQATDMDDLDPSASLHEGMPVTNSFPSRVQMGRGTAGPLASGMAPNSVAVLEANEGIVPTRPGVLVTDTIDIGVLTSGVGADEFCVYWYIYDFDTTQDIRASVGFFAGQNLPALRKVIEVPQEPSDFEVFISINDGANFFPVNRLLPIAFCSPGLLIRLAFKNTNPLKKKYLAGYAILF